MTKQPRHRPRRVFENAERVIIECDLRECPHCGQTLKPRNTWHMRKTVQTLKGPVIVGGKTRECANPDCSHSGKHYSAGNDAVAPIGGDQIAFTRGIKLEAVERTLDMSILNLP